MVVETTREFVYSQGTKYIPKSKTKILDSLDRSAKYLKKLIFKIVIQDYNLGKKIYTPYYHLIKRN